MAPSITGAERSRNGTNTGLKSPRRVGAGAVVVVAAAEARRIPANFTHPHELPLPAGRNPVAQQLVRQSRDNRIRKLFGVHQVGRPASITT